MDPGGEVTAIDSAGFGPISIGKSVTITSPPGVEAGIVPSPGSAAVTISIFGNMTFVVQLRGLTLDGTGGGTNGIAYIGGGIKVEIIDCLIHNFSNDGILLSNGGGLTSPNTMIIANTVVSNNDAFGIEINPTDPFVMRGNLDHISATGNGQSGISINGTNTSAFVGFTISNSVSDSNASNGIEVQGIGNAKVEIRDSILSNNLSWGIAVANAKVGLYANSLVINGAAFSNSSGTIFSFGKQQYGE